MRIAAAATIGIVAVGFLVRSFVGQWNGAKDAIGHADWTLLTVGLVLAFLSMAHLAVLWGRSLAWFNATASYRQVIVWWFVGETGKYVPGGVLSVVGRAEVARRAGVPRAAAYGSVPLSLVLRYLAGMLMFAVLLPLDLAHQGSWATVVVLVLVPLGLVAFHPAIVNRALGLLRRATGKQLDFPVPSWRAAIGEILTYVPNWLLVIGATWCAARALTGDPSLLRIALATLLSWIVGFLVFPVPAGAGIREAVFVASSGLSPGVALTVAIVSRVLFIAADGAGALLATAALRGTPLAAALHEDVAAGAGDPVDGDPGVGSA